MAEEPAPGWYNDPKDPTQLRWWDGTTWGEMTQAKTEQPSAPQGASYQGFQAQPSAAYGSGNTVERGLQQAEGFYGKHKTGIDTIAGAALVTDGLIGDPLTGRGGGIGGAVGGFFVGLIFIGIGIFVSVAMAVPSTLSGRAVGTVTNLGVSSTTNSNGTTSTLCAPQVLYTVGGHTYTAQQGYAGQCGTALGQQMQVAYNPFVPSSSTVPATGPIVYLPWGLIGIGVLALIAGIFQLIKSVFLVGAGGVLLAKSVKDRRR